LRPGNLAAFLRACPLATDVCHCLNFYTPAGFEQAILACSRPAERRGLPPPGLDATDSPQVVRFFNNYWAAPATLPWAQQKWSRG